MDLQSEFLNTLGLLIDLAAVWIVGSAVIESKDDSLELGLFGFASIHEDENLKNPNVQDRRRASRRALVGGLLFTVGIFLQIWATWLR